MTTSLVEITGPSLAEITGLGTFPQASNHSEMTDLIRKQIMSLLSFSMALQVSMEIKWANTEDLYGETINLHPCHITTFIKISTISHGFGFGQGQGQARWQHNQHQGQGTSRSHERPRTSDGDGEYRCIICKDNLQNSEERGIHLCDGGFKKENKENFIVNYEDIDARLECLLQELKGCLKKKYESVTQTLESYVSERIDEINTLHKDMTEDRSHLETMKTALEEKSAELEKLEKNLRDKENQIKEDRKKLDKETQEEKEEICRQWQQLRDEIVRMEKLHEVQKGRIRLDIGGCQYTTSRLTLTRDSESMLAAMFSGRHPIKTEDDGTVFIDRDGTHFRYILNYLRDGGVQVEALPRNRQVLRELKREAIFYQLHGLVQQIEKLI
ncbi:hypothetical protein FSP39_022869 [Pinctada imbricata]|uniref:BTB domain-containing protein n=1 Tax=Pinctada imbricata TaxID=66713 RepID=A0AA88YKR0_PINIB|nr:hypothetical protein FSP39_022869 [Pinctada imbricata]